MDKANTLPLTSNTPPSSPSKQRDAFAYQTRLLQRTTSRSSTNSLSRNSSISSRPTSLVSPTTTGSNPPVVPATRRWTPSHRPGTSLDTVRDKWEERARVEAVLDGRRSVSPTKQFETTPSRSSLGHSDSISTISSPSSFTDSSLQRTSTYHKRHTFSASLPPHIVATPLSPNTTGISVENPDSSTNSFSTPTHHRIRLPTAASIHSSSLPDIKELDHHVPSPISLDSPSPPTQRSNTIDSNILDSAAHDPVSRIADPFTSTVINTPCSPSKSLFTPETSTTIRRRPTSLYGSQSSSFPFPEKEPLSGRISASQDITDHTLRLPSRVSRVSDHTDLTSKLPDLSSRISAYTSRFDSRSFDSTSRSAENISSTVLPIVDRTSRAPDITTRVAEYTSRLNSSERPSPSPTHTPTSSFASTQNSFTSTSSSTPPQTPNSSITSIPSTSSSVMSPAPYRSSYMSSKKSSTYGQIAGHKLGRHLPRIASGDAGDDWVDEQKPNPLPQPEHAPVVDDSQVVSRRARRNSRYEPPASPITEELVAGMTNASDVTGIPGRLRLSRDQTPASPTAPTTLPSSRLTRGLWADVQRHLLQAYEYLCHVGEAQQWIEGCLGEELGFGVVEMEEGMRNGVVLARLVRVFKGEGGFRIYEVRWQFKIV